MITKEDAQICIIWSKKGCQKTPNFDFFSISLLSRSLMPRFTLFFVRKKFGSKKNLNSKIFWGNTNFGSTKFRGHKKLGAQKFWGLKIWSN